MLTTEEASWLACAVDGEGTITVIDARRRGQTQHVYVPIVTVSNCNRAFISRATRLIRQSCGAGATCRAHNGVNYPVLKSQVVSQKSCAVLLVDLLPHLIVKRGRAEAILTWIDARKEARKRRPTRGGGTPYGPETDQLFAALAAHRLDG